MKALKPLIAAFAAIMALQATAVMYEIDYHKPDFSIVDNGLTYYYYITYDNPDEVGITYGDIPYNVKDFVIPSTVRYNNKTYPVTRMGCFTFANNQTLESITLPETMKIVNNHVFRNCNNLKYTRFTGDLRQWCGIAFASNPVSWSHNLYVNTTEPVEGELIVPSGVRELVNVFNGLTTITSVTFPDTDMQYVYLSSSFEGCENIRSVSVSSIEQWFKLMFSQASPTKYSHSLTVGGSELTNVVVPAYVTTINECQFQGLENLKSVTLHENVNILEANVFEGCTGLTSISLPEKLISIGSGTFKDCTGLSGTLTIPEEVTSLNYSAFENCTGLETLDIKGTKIYGLYSAFAGCTGLKTVNVPDVATWCNRLGDFEKPEYNPLYYAGALSVGGRELINLEIPEGVTGVKRYAFCGARKMKSLKFPSTFKKVGECAFYLCEGLEMVEAPSLDMWLHINADNTYNSDGISSPVYYSRKLLLGGEQYTDVTIPDDITTINAFTFQGWDWLKSITLPNNVKSFAQRQCMMGCDNIESIYIGSGINDLEWNFEIPFPDMKHVFCANPVPPEGSGWYPCVTSVATLFVPRGCRQAYESARFWKSFKRIVELDFDGIETSVADGSEAIAVSAANGELTITGAPAGTPVTVTAIDGRVLYCGTNTHITLPGHGLAIVTVATHTQKVAF